MSKRIAVIAFGAVGAASIAAGWIAFAVHGETDGAVQVERNALGTASTAGRPVVHVSASRIEADTLDDLIGRSQLIVVGTLVGEREEHFDIPVGPAGTAPLPRVDLVRTFSVRETWKGNAGGQSVDVRYTTSSGTFAPDAAGRLQVQSVPWEAVALVDGKTYVLFLLSGTEPVVGTSWGQAAEPGVATIGDGTLSFVSTRGYAKDHNIGSGTDPGLGESFNVAPDVLRARIAESAKRP